MADPTKEKKYTHFRDIVSAAMHDQGVTQKQLSRRMNTSQPSISRALDGKRPFEGSFAKQLTQELGGRQQDWEEIYSETQGGSEYSIGYFLARLYPSTGLESAQRRASRYLVDFEIIELFSKSEFGPEEEICEIGDFDPERVMPTSYDTHIGWLANGEGKPDTELNGKFTLESRSTATFATEEAFHMPSWMEAEVHPATSFGRKGLFVANGPIIDPGFDGYLSVTVYNPSEAPIEIEPDEPFLTIRFRILDTVPKFINKKHEDI